MMSEQSEFVNDTLRQDSVLHFQTLRRKGGRYLENILGRLWMDINENTFGSMKSTSLRRRIMKKNSLPVLIT